MSVEPHVFTLTGNLLAERTLEFDTWAPGKTQRATAESFQVGGKGINVAKMLTRLGAANTSLCFTGGAPGAECEAWLRALKFSFHAFPTTAPTRCGTVVRARAMEETTFLGPDVGPDEAAIRACAEFLNAQGSGAVLAVCGSLPGWATPQYAPLREAITRWPERGALVVDTYGPPLQTLADAAPTLVKINRAELESLFGVEGAAASTRDLLLRLRDRFRARRWAVTDGPAPVWFIDELGDPETMASPAVRPVSATGSGDVMLACALFAHFHQHRPWRDAVAWSLPWAAANAAHAEIAEFPPPALT